MDKLNTARNRKVGRNGRSVAGWRFSAQPQNPHCGLDCAGVLLLPSLATYFLCMGVAGPSPTWIFFHIRCRQFCITINHRSHDVSISSGCTKTQSCMSMSIASLLMDVYQPSSRHNIKRTDYIPQLVTTQEANFTVHHVLERSVNLQN